MTEFLIYNGKVAVLLAVFYLFYRLLMERETFHRLNRAVLLLSVLASYILPACIFTTHQIVTVSASLTGYQQIDMTPIQTNTQNYWPIILFAVYLIGVSARLLYSVVSTFRLHHFISLCEKHPQKDGTMIAVCNQNIAPFSWWNTIVLSRSDFETHDAALIAHEETHIHSYHSVDILLMEILLALQWFNPAAWLVKRDLRSVHEYEADASVLAHGIDAHHYLTLLMDRSSASTPYTLANSISQKALKGRFLMMARKHSSPHHVFRLLYILIIIGCTLALNARTIKEVRIIQTPRSVKGFASDLNRNPIVGVQVSVKGKQDRIVSDHNGEYYINACDGDTIVWNYQGDSAIYELKGTDNYVAFVADLTDDQQRHQRAFRSTMANYQDQSATKYIKVSGLVLDEQGQPITGAVVKVHDLPQRTISDFDGCFALSIPQGSTLDVMYGGMGTCSFSNLSSSMNLKVTLFKDSPEIK